MNELQQVLNASKKALQAEEKAAEILENEILSNIENTEQKRIDKFQWLTGALFLVFITGIALIFYLKLNFNPLEISTVMFSMFIYLFFAVITLGVAYEINARSWLKEIKSRLRPCLLKAFGGEIKESNEMGTIDRETIEPAYQDYSSKTTDDSFYGNFGNISYALDEMKLTSGTGKNRHIVFQGLGVSINLPEASYSYDNENYLRLIKKPSSLSANPVISIIFYVLVSYFLFFNPQIAPFFAPHKFSLIICIVLLFIFSILSAASNKKILSDTSLKPINIAGFEYLIETSSEEYSAETLTDGVVEIIKNIMNKLGAFNVNCYFEGKTLSFFFETSRNLFEIGNILDPSTDKKFYNNCINELACIFELIYYLSFRYDNKEE